MPEAAALPLWEGAKQPPPRCPCSRLSKGSRPKSDEGQPVRLARAASALRRQLAARVASLSSFAWAAGPRGLGDRRRRARPPRRAGPARRSERLASPHAGLFTVLPGVGEALVGDEAPTADRLRVLGALAQAGEEGHRRRLPACSIGHPRRPRPDEGLQAREVGAGEQRFEMGLREGDPASVARAPAVDG